MYYDSLYLNIFNVHQQNSKKEETNLEVLVKQIMKLHEDNYFNCYKTSELNMLGMILHVCLVAH